MDYEFKVLGALKSKANSRIIRYLNGRPISIKNPDALAFEKTAVQQLQKQFKRKKMIEDKVGLELDIYYPSNRNDLSPELFFDCLQKAGVLKNDRQIVEYSCFKKIDKLEPRVECCLYIINEE